MNNTVTHIERTEAPRAQQLTLLSVPNSPSGELKSSSAHTRFQLSAAMRKRGLEHVAEIRRQLAESEEQRRAAATPTLPHRHHHAA